MVLNESFLLINLFPPLSTPPHWTVYLKSLIFFSSDSWSTQLLRLKSISRGKPKSLPFYIYLFTSLLPPPFVTCWGTLNQNDEDPLPFCFVLCDEVLRRISSALSVRKKRKREKKQTPILGTSLIVSLRATCWCSSVGSHRHWQPTVKGIKNMGDRDWPDQLDILVLLVLFLVSLWVVAIRWRPLNRMKPPLPTQSISSVSTFFFSLSL